MDTCFVCVLFFSNFKKKSLSLVFVLFLCRLSVDPAYRYGGSCGVHNLYTHTRIAVLVEPRTVYTLVTFTRFVTP